MLVQVIKSNFSTYIQFDWRIFYSEHTHAKLALREVEDEEWK